MNALTTTSSQEEDVSSARIDDMLRGAYIALKNADSQSSPLPVKTRLVLASAGSTEQGWQQVIAQQKAVSTTSAQGRLIAIAGMGISVTQTQQIQAMIRYLERPGEPLAAVKGKRPPVAVVADVNIDDLYKQSMQTGFDAFFPNLPQDATHPYSYIPLPKGIPPSGQFTAIAADLCQTSPPPVVLYEGGANVTVYYADIEQHQASQPFATEYVNLAEKITGPVNPLPQAARNDPWMLATYIGAGTAKKSGRQ